MNVALILSGGVGTRMKAPIPKQYIKVNDNPLFYYTLKTLETHQKIDKIQIVADKSWHELFLKYVGEKFHGFSHPGANRQLSILNGLCDILDFADREDNVIIQDAVRPLTQQDMISEILTKLELYDAVTPILPLKDTIYVYEDKKFTGIANRDILVAGQAPEGFRLGKYYDATLALCPNHILSITGSLEVALLGNLKVASIKGDEQNFKITTMKDLDRLQQILKN